MSTDFMNSSGSAWIIHESRLPGGGDDVACEGLLQYVEQAARKSMR